MQPTFEQLNPAACRTYLVTAENSSEATLIDPLLDHVNDYLRLLEGRGLRLVQILDTHTHADHIQGAAALRDRTGCVYVMHAAAPAHCVSDHVKDGDVIEIGGVRVRVMHTPGHTKDSITLVFPDRVLTGDVLFLDDAGAGRDDLPGGDAAEHWESLQRILGLPDHLVVHPAHEYRNRLPSSLKLQRERNPHLAPRSREEYVRYLENLMLGPAEWMKDVLKANYACARDPRAAWIPVDVPACEVKGTLAPGVNEQEVRWLAPGEFAKRRERGDDMVLLDVREARELEEELGHLPGIVHIPVGALSARLAEMEPYRDREVVTICRMGGRAHTAAQILLAAGFRKVAVLEGGMAGLRNLEG